MRDFINSVIFKHAVNQILHIVVKTWQFIADYPIELSELRIFDEMIPTYNIHCMMQPFQDYLTLVHDSEKVSKLYILGCVFL